jgi:hypothetical protein
MRLLLSVEFSRMPDHAKVASGMTMLDRTMDKLRAGGDLDDAARAIITPAVRAAVRQAEKEYREDLARATFFQVRLPWRPFPEESPAGGKQPDQRRSVDAIYLDDPVSVLFKELARGDRERSRLRQGFSLMIVARSLPVQADRPVKRYIISTDPLSGFHLQGLGEMCEKAEQDKENTSGLPLFEGRERVGEGQGRHGYNVVSPWYDGRGHQFTIMDSPSVKIAGVNVCASGLLPSEIIDILKKYEGRGGDK